MQTRRYFLKTLSAGGVGLFVRGRRGRAIAQIPGGTLNPLSLPKYQTPLLIPPVMPRAGTITERMGKNVDYYEISVKQFPEQILPRAFRRQPYGVTAPLPQYTTGACYFTTHHP